MNNNHIGVAALAGVAAAASVLTGCSLQNQQWHNDCVVIAKDVLYSSTDGNTSRDYRLSTSCGTFAVEDTLAGGFDSWDVWQSLDEGATYDLRTGGYRVGFFSMFPSVIEVRDADQNGSEAGR
ncbi:hypothetical protein [Mycolicibacterium palauense]|uniref:hypothetical protein n=1 Tax=Mycolicibacterium palauense TaxID=2034511 RepID=UPI000BFF0DFF|nr:hypothetical protein [Mycolicibacterium palauense]